ncbi:MAG: hypothetical protein AB8B57_14460 [Congregibacter sp.]
MKDVFRHLKRPGPALLLLLCASTASYAQQSASYTQKTTPAEETTAAGPGSDDGVALQASPDTGDSNSAGATGAAVSDGTGDPRQLSSSPATAAYLSLDIKPYMDNIAAIEQVEGAFAIGLAEPLLSAGLALQRNGAHEQAIRLFKRGVHLTRINEGLHSPQQIAMLQGEIASHVALNAYEDADERQRYLHRIQSRSLSDAFRGDAYMQYARWQRQAYEAGIGEDPFNRLQRMLSLYRMALAEYVDLEGIESPKQLDPLYGMLRASYLISGFVGQTTSSGFSTQWSNDAATRRAAYRGQRYKEGEAIIRRIFDVYGAQPEFSIEEQARVSQMLADWQLWNGKRDEALQTYAAIDGELAAMEGAQVIREKLFGRPHPLPALEGVRAFPMPKEEQEGYLLLEFGVTDRGRVTDLTRLDTHPANDEIAGRVIRRLKQTPFRPRISDGAPVATQGLRWAYDTSIW